MIRKWNHWIRSYFGSGEKVEFPEVRKTKYTKDFSWGFYCAKSYDQAYKWADRKSINDIAEGSMADDTIWNFVNDFLAGNMSRKVFWEGVQTWEKECWLR